MTDASAADTAYQQRILAGVSRTFALTIPQLPPALREAVGNAYLLCRIADTIEDDAGLPAARKRAFAEQFIEVVEGDFPAHRFAADLYPLLAPATPEDERSLILNTERVIRVTHGFNTVQRQAMARCVRIMARGMADFQDQGSIAGLADMAALDRYCYVVAGVVGEMLTDLFCDYSAAIAAQRETLQPLAVSFGQGLQMTNILKDLWEDHHRGACWLPRSVFEARGIDLATLTPATRDPGFDAAFGDLIAIARSHLDDALSYTLRIPPRETGIRRFCLWALGMAVLTLRKIDAHRDFTSGQEVKISRRSVKATIIATSIAVRSDRWLRLMFELAGRALPRMAVPALPANQGRGSAPPP
ncbi:MAG: phytoene/squalene synthase family protein [Gammaproteobacteria bacterium]|nr:phytoene/squalene synthase family protein [Gammaproteobacteria bacterium]